MTSSALTPEVIDGPTQVFEETPMTEQEEKELVIVKTAICTAYADKLERDLAIGAGLLKVFRRKLYRGKEGGRSWEQWLAEESAELTAGRGALGKETAHRLRGFYQFRCEVVGSMAGRPSDMPLPASPYQIRPLLGQLDTHPKAALEMYKAACAQAGKGNVPTFDQVNRAAIAYKANADNEARRLSAAQQERMHKATAAAKAARPAPEPAPEPVQDFSPAPQPEAAAPSIPAWEIQKDDNSVDAGEECRRITSALNDAHKAIGLLRGILYNQINKYGQSYLGYLRQVDAGVYSLNNIDDQIRHMCEDVAFIEELLTSEVGEGELAKSTIEVEAMPKRY